MNLTIKKGAIIGFVVGLVVLAGVLVMALSCLSIRLSSLPRPWSWYCSDPTYNIIGYFAFPVNLLTNDLSQAILLAPISLLIYTILGALIGSGFAIFTSSSQDE